MSFVMRPGVGDGRGEGVGVGVGVWAIAFNGRFATVNPAAPAAGRSLTKVRRLIEVRFDFSIESSLVWYTDPATAPVGLLADPIQRLKGPGEMSNDLGDFGRTSLGPNRREHALHGS